MKATSERALFNRLPRLADIVPFTPLADGLPTPIERVAERLWVQRDDRTSSRYGGNKVRKLEHVLAVAHRRGGPVLTAGGTGSHHILATALHAQHLGLEVEAVTYPQPATVDAIRTHERIAALDVRCTPVPNRYLMPAGLAARLAALAPRRPYLLWPGASTPVGALGYVGAGLELVETMTASGHDEPDSVVVALGSGGTAVGMALGLALAGWRHCRVIAVRCADVSVTNSTVVAALEKATAAVLAMGGWRPRPAAWQIDGRWLGHGYGHPSPAGDHADLAAAELGIELEPTYTAKAFAAALDRLDRGQRVVFVNTFAGPSALGL